ncbi:MAG TPA: InlB B-repeat-containing protein, partial [Methanocorpusculum sp.]|nr:InlB B-repeat-containing protein [Methanocorpusculum sp.]
MFRSFVFNGRIPINSVLLSLLIILVFAISVMPVYAAFGGSGSFEDPFQINNAADLKQLAEDVNGGNSYDGKFFKVTQNIDLSSVCSKTKGSWKPIGDKNHPFCGTFDGGGYTISKLFIKPELGVDYPGLFGCALNANFTNVHLTNVQVTCNTNNKGAVGGLIGSNSVNSMRSSTIENCSVTGDVESLYIYDKSLFQGKIVGGLIGSIYLDWKSTESIITIKNCSVTGNVKGNMFIGGLIGRCDFYSNPGSNTISIENCYATVDVEGNLYIGGLIGYNNLVKGTGTIENCHASGKVISDKKKENVGGLIGSNNVDSKSIITIKNCDATGDVSSSFWKIGGLIGENRVQGISTIENCYTTGKVSGIRWVGGLVGHNEIKGISTIKNCYATGDVSSGEWGIGGLIGVNQVKVGSSTIENCYSTGEVSGKNMLGGLVGSNEIHGSSTIKNCYTIGDVSSNEIGDGISSISMSYAGGLVGYNKLDETSMFIIENTYAVGNVSGDYDVGGLIGYNYVSSGNMYVNNSSALNQYVNGTSIVGRIVGSNIGDGTLEFSNNYGWEGMKNSKYDTLFTEDENNGTNVSSMQAWGNESFYKNDLHWDISIDDSKIWKIEEDHDNNYPLPYITSLKNNDLWRPKVIHLKPLIVKFNKNSDSAAGDMNPQGFTLNVYKALSENNFTKTGYTFIGWNESSSEPGFEKRYVDKYEFGFEIPDPKPEKIMLYALWKPKITNVTLNFNNDSSDTHTVNITYDSGEFSETPIKPIYEGHTFLGYNNTEIDGVQVINDTQKLVQDAIGYSESGKWKNESSDILLWAAWKPNVT